MTDLCQAPSLAATTSSRHSSMKRTSFQAASSSSKVKVTIATLNAACSSSCAYSGLDIYTKSDARAAGYRFCCSSQKPTLISEGNLIRIVAFRRVYGVSATITVSTDCSDSSTKSVVISHVEFRSCAAWNSQGFCSSTVYTDATKQSYCAQTCGFCSGSGISVSATTSATCVDASTK